MVRLVGSGDGEGEDGAEGLELFLVGFEFVEVDRGPKKEKKPATRIGVRDYPLHRLLRVIETVKK